MTDEDDSDWPYRFIGVERPLREDGPLGSFRRRTIEASPLRIEHALILLRDQLRTVQGFRYIDPEDPEGRPKRLANLLRPYRFAVAELEEWVLANQYLELHRAERSLSGVLWTDATDALRVLPVVGALQGIAFELGYSALSIEDTEDGSIFVRLKAFWTAISSDERTLKTAEVLAAEALRLLESRTVEVSQAKVDSLNSESMQRLINSTETLTNVTARVGALVLIKSPEQTYVRTLSAREISLLDSYPGVMKDPSRFEIELAALKQAPTDPTSGP